MRVLPSCFRVCGRILYPRCWSFVARTLTGVSVLAFGVLSAQANELQGAPDHWGANTFFGIGVESCVGVIERPENQLSTVIGCMGDQVISVLFGATLQSIDEHGTALFGENFRLDHRLDFSASDGGISGDLDAVIPLNSFTSTSHDRVTRGLFFQNGLSRWRDEHGFQRNDMRFGMVHRILTSERPDAGVFGTSFFFQENLEWGHARIVAGLDYSDGRGRGSLTYFIPVTDWRPGRFGYEERALEGMEFDLRYDVTHTIELRTGAGHRESKDGSGDWTTHGSFSIRWQPHPWFRLRGNWDDIGTADDSLGLHAVVSVPFGESTHERLRWRGLGLTDLNSDEPVPGLIWKPVDNVGHIEVARRGTLREDEPDEPAYPQFEPIFGQMSPSQ